MNGIRADAVTAFQLLAAARSTIFAGRWTAARAISQAHLYPGLIINELERANANFVQHPSRTHSTTADTLGGTHNAVSDHLSGASLLCLKPASCMT